MSMSMSMMMMMMMMMMIDETITWLREEGWFQLL
jgi:hypothetical protein